MLGKKINITNAYEFKNVFDKYGRLAFHISALMTKNAEDAKDIVQDVFIALFNCKISFSNYKKLRRWIVCVTRNLSNNLLTKRFREEAYLINEAEMNCRDYYFVDDYTDIDIDLVLSREEKTIVVFHLIDELTFEYIAEIMNKTLASTKRTYRSSLKRIKYKLFPSRIKK